MSGQDPHERFRALLGAYALGALEPGERAALEQHLAGCESCRDDLAGYRAPLGALTPSAPVPDAVWRRVESEIGGGSAPEGSPRTSARRARLRRRVGGVVAAVAVLAVAIAVPMLATSRDEPSKGTAAPIVPDDEDTAVSGTVELFDPNGPSARIAIELTDLPRSPAGHHYQVWVLRSEGAGAMEAIGAFSPDSRTTRLELPLPGAGDYRAVDISVQEDGGPTEHSGLSVAHAALP